VKSPFAPFGQAPILQVKNLHVRLGGQSILENVTLDVARASIHAIIGPNGGGKTTFMRSLLGGMPHQGDIRFWFEGRRKIGYVPQFIEFDHTLPMTVGDFLCIMVRRWPIFFRTPQKTRRTLVQLLAKTGSEYLIDRLLGGLSGGEFRRVLLAQALLPEPEILLLDEPASNVDEQGSRLLERLLLSLKETGVTIIMVGHDIPMILRIADQITAINKRVTFSGTPNTLNETGSLAQLFGVAQHPHPVKTTQVVNG
jgi:zinc transport system ATP-binding protein